jgi:hypothetical protein
MSRQSFADYGFSALPMGEIAVIMVKDTSENGVTSHYEYYHPSWDNFEELCNEHGFPVDYTTSMIKKAQKDRPVWSIIFDKQIFLKTYYESSKSPETLIERVARLERIVGI